MCIIHVYIILVPDLILANRPHYSTYIWQCWSLVALQQNVIFHKLWNLYHYRCPIGHCSWVQLQVVVRAPFRIGYLLLSFLIGGQSKTPSGDLTRALPPVQYSSDTGHFYATLCNYMKGSCNLRKRTRYIQPTMPLLMIW